MAPCSHSQAAVGLQCMILSISLRSLYALVLHLCLTGLPEVAMPYSDMWQDCQITFPHTRPCYGKSSYRSVDPQTLQGNVHQVDHVPNGPTNSTAITTMFPLRLCVGSHWSRSLESEATRADYALTTTTMPTMHQNPFGAGELTALNPSFAGFYWVRHCK